MRGNGNSIGTLTRKIWFYILPTSGLRSRYVRKHANLFRHVGRNLFYQSRKFPADPEYISIGNNVKITADVVFINHDTSSDMLNHKFETNEFAHVRGCIEIGDNVMIGTGTRILPNVRIGSNVVIGAGSIVTKDIPDNCVAAGVPCKEVGTFEHFVEKRRQNQGLRDENLWDAFYEQRK